MIKYNKIIKDYILIPFKYYELKLINNKNDFIEFLKNHILYLNKEKIKNFESDLSDRLRFFLIINLYLISVSEKDIKYFSIISYCKDCKAKNTIITNFEEIKFDYDKDKYPYVLKRCNNCNLYSLFNLEVLLYDINKIMEIFLNIY